MEVNMVEPITIESTIITLLPALIGAISGSFGGNVISNYIKEKSERESKRRFIIDTYLIQLQDFTEALWHRFNNIKNKGGRMVMDNSYFEESTLYSLGCILAYRRILLFAGIYSQIDTLIPGLGVFLKEKLNDLDKILDTGRVSLYRYHRLLLAEVIIDKENGKLNVCSYLKFKELYEDKPRIKEFLKPSKEWVSNLKGHEVEPLMMILSEIIKRIVKETGIETNITEL